MKIEIRTALHHCGTCLLTLGIVLTGCGKKSAPTPSQLAFSVQPSTTTAGETITPSVAVEIRDSAGNKMVSATSSITLTIAETSDFGILRLIVNDPDKAAAALKKQSITCSTTDVLALEIDDTPGSLYKAIETFARMNLNIEYMYAFTEKREDKAVMIFRFDDIEEAKKALKTEGYNIVSKINIIGE